MNSIEPMVVFALKTKLCSVFFPTTYQHHWSQGHDFDQKNTHGFWPKSLSVVKTKKIRLSEAKGRVNLLPTKVLGTPQKDAQFKNTEQCRGE